MKKYAKIINETTGAVEVGVGDPDAVFSIKEIEIEPPSEQNPDGVWEQKIIYVRDFYESIGLELTDVEQGYDGNWYLAGKAPAPPAVKKVRTFAKDAIWVATKDMILDSTTGETAWEAFKSFLIDSGLWEGWTMQAYLLEENPFFAEFYPRAVAVFGAELVDSVLAASVVETKEITVE